jgi:hypothetical protein
MHVPEGFEKFYLVGFVLLLLKTIYGLKQTEIVFWKQLLKAFASMNSMRSKVDPSCLYFAWTVNGLVIWISWVDDCLVCGREKGVMHAKAQMMEQFDCDEVGNMNEYVGCKVERNHEEGSIKMTQPVMLQSFTDEFNLPEGPVPNTPATPGDALVRAKPEDCISDVKQFKYRSGAGTTPHDALVSSRDYKCCERIVALHVWCLDGACKGNASSDETLHWETGAWFIVEPRQQVGRRSCI